MKHQSTGNHQVYTTSGIRFRPLIAASLAVALGVSVASAASDQANLTASASLDDNKTIAQKDLVEVTKEVSGVMGKAGILANIETTDAALTMADHSITFSGTGIAGAENIYGILLHKDSKHSLTFSSAQSALIHFDGFADGSKLHAIQNSTADKTLTFDKVSILVGEDKIDGVKYGIQNNLSGVSYGFGAAGTTFSAITGDAATAGGEGLAAATEAKAAVGVLVTEKTNFAGKLTFQGITGGSSAAATGDNANGANAYGLVTNAATLDLGQGEIIFTAINGGAKKTSSSGKDGSAFGIFNDGASTIQNGTITIIAIGTSDALSKYILQNQSGTLTLTDASIIAGSKGEFASTAGILSNIAGVSYDFGTGEAKTIFNVTGTAGSNATTLRTTAIAGKDAAGAIIANNTTFAGNLELNIAGGKGGNGAKTANGANGGKAIGMYGHSGTLTLADTSVFSMNVQGGQAGEAGTDGAAGIQGDAVALYAGGDFIIKGAKEDAVNVISASVTGANVYGISVADTKTLTLENAKLDLTLSAEGEAGNAVGIYRDNNGSAASAIQGVGTIHIASATGADTFVIKNVGEEGKALNIGKTSGGKAADSQITLIAGEDSGRENSTLYGIYHNLQGAKYDFGTGGTVYTLIGTDGKPAKEVQAADGQNAIGVAIKQDAEFMGKLTLDVKGGASVESGTAGSATGLKVSNATLDARAATLTLKVGSENTSNATALELENGKFAGSFTVDSTNAIGNESATSATLIKSIGESTIQSGIITLKDAEGLKAASDGAKILDNSGTLTFGEGATINLGSPAFQTAHINVANGQTANLSLGANSVTNFTDQAFALEASAGTSGSINLALGDQAGLNFNAKAGDEVITKVTLAQDAQKPNTGAIFNLAGESGKINGTPIEGRVAKTLTISDLDTSAGNQFILYVDVKDGQAEGETKTYSADKVVVSTTSTGAKDDKTQSQAQKLSIVFDEDKKSDILSITRENNVLVATSSDSKVKFDTTNYAAMGFNYASVSFVAEQEAPQTPDSGETVEGYADQTATPTNYYIGEVKNQGVMQSDIQAVASAFMFNYDLYLANFNSLNKRMGELRDNANAHGVWARVFNGQISNDLGLGTKSNYTTIQAGYDYAFGMDGANNYLGLAVSYGLSSSKMSSKARDFMGQERSLDGISTNAVEVAVYNSYVSDSGWYNDTIAKFSYLMSNFTIQNANTGRNEKLNLNNIGLTISDEVGYRFKLGEAQEWYIDPQVEIGFGYFNKTDLQRVAGSSFMNVDADSVMMLRARAGAAFAYDFKQFIQAKDVAASLYAGLFYEYDYINSGSLAIQTDVDNTSASSALKSDGRIAINVGTNIQATENVRIYADFEKSFEGKINTDYQINAGVRYSFGENVDYKPAKAQESKKAPLKLENETSSEEETAQEEN